MSNCCKFCGTFPGSGEAACVTEQQAFAVTAQHPHGCAWFTHEDREPFLAKRWKRDSDGSWFRSDALGYAYRVHEIDNGRWVSAWTEKYPSHGLRISPHSEASAEEAMKRMDDIAAEDHRQKVAAIVAAIDPTLSSTEGKSL